MSILYEHSICEGIVIIKFIEDVVRLLKETPDTKTIADDKIKPLDFRASPELYEFIANGVV